MSMGTALNITVFLNFCRICSATRIYNLILIEVTIIRVGFEVNAITPAMFVSDVFRCSIEASLALHGNNFFDSGNLRRMIISMMMIKNRG